MNEVCYLVFGTDGIVTLRGYDIPLPERFRGYPVIRIKDSVYRVQINTLVIENDDVRGMMRACILQAFKDFSEFGAVRVEFPAWYIMHIYAVERSAAEEPYWDPEQLVDSFLSLRGPEMIL